MADASTNVGNHSMYLALIKLRVWHSQALDISSHHELNSFEKMLKIIDSNTLYDSRPDFVNGNFWNRICLLVTWMRWNHVIAGFQADSQFVDHYMKEFPLSASDQITDSLSEFYSGALVADKYSLRNLRITAADSCALYLEFGVKSLLSLMSLSADFINDESNSSQRVMSQCKRQVIHRGTAVLRAISREIDREPRSSRNNDGSSGSGAAHIIAAASRAGGIGGAADGGKLPPPEVRVRVDPQAEREPEAVTFKGYWDVIRRKEMVDFFRAVSLSEEQCLAFEALLPNMTYVSLVKNRDILTDKTNKLVRAILKDEECQNLSKAIKTLAYHMHFISPCNRMFYIASAIPSHERFSFLMNNGRAMHNSPATTSRTPGP